jgi:uncharacterized protein YbjT (DUF2867 family)
MFSEEHRAQRNEVSPMTSNRTILITGVTGNQGGAVAQALQGSGFNLRGLTRKPDSERAAALAREAGVEHYVYTSVGSAHKQPGVPRFDNKWRIEETVRGLNFSSHVILRPVSPRPVMKITGIEVWAEI